MGPILDPQYDLLAMNAIKPKRACDLDGLNDNLMSSIIDVSAYSDDQLDKTLTSWKNTLKGLDVAKTGLLLKNIQCAEAEKEKRLKAAAEGGSAGPGGGWLSQVRCGLMFSSSLVTTHSLFSTGCLFRHVPIRQKLMEDVQAA